ncbi:MAG: DUF420 domain-containing protein [Vicinamibacterales bacterium]
MGIADLPALNATLNGLSFVLLATGITLIKQGRREAHRRTMLAALGSSALFLISYVIYHLNVLSKPFEGQGPIRYVYFTILITHVILAAAIVPLVLITVRRGLRADFERHRAIARITFPLWMYVSVTGVVIYVMLYQMH